ncbi:MAG: serine/threonine protein kinase [Alphaproteobacteria bacterium]|nr:serine/threonine protein kinase [Alphaproteobacteria bacterium]
MQEVTDWTFSPGDPAWLAPGQDIDRFEVEARIGQGAHAVVYRVQHSALGTRHALKVLTNADETVRKRLLQEGRIQAELQHPNVVAVTDVLELPHTLGLVMDYVYGPPLADWLRAQQPDVEQALDIFRNIVEGVRAAHRLGIVHRDLKPANVLMAWDGQRYTPRVTDFGLAKVERKPGAMGSAQALGTPAYMAPEQIRDAARVDPRADIFSLGCILYELLCGVRPFRTLEIPVLFNEILNGRYPPPEKLNPELPEHLLVTIRRCLEVERWRRPPSCDVLLHMLDGFDEGAAVEPTPAPRLVEGPTLHSGTLLEGRYELAEKLGQGGLGEVWRAFDRAKRVEVAIKLMHRQWLEEPGRVESFLHSARKMAALRHRHLVRVLQPYGDHQGQVFYVMEYLDGGDLVTRLKDGPLRVEEIVSLVDALAGALGAAHAKGMIHRNIKPRNVMFDARGRAVLTDFDLAMPGADEDGERRVDAIDTFLFAAPERTRSPQKPGRRADQYSLAMLAVYALHGRSLHMGVVYDTRGFIQELEAPNRVKRVLARALSVDPTLRFESVTALAEALRGAAASKATRAGASGELKSAELWALEGKPVDPPAPKRPGRLLSALLLVLAGVGGVAIGWVGRSLAPPLDLAAWIAPPPDAPEVTEPAVTEAELATAELTPVVEAPPPSQPPPAVVVAPPPRLVSEVTPSSGAKARFTVVLTLDDPEQIATLRCRGEPDHRFQGRIRVGMAASTPCVLETPEAYGTLNLSRDEERRCEILDTTISCEPR